MSRVKETIASGRAVLGIELGSTRIKSILIGEDCNPVASGGYEWSNSYTDGIWTYELDDVWRGIQASYLSMKVNVHMKYGIDLEEVAGIGISAMMHGYMPFNSEDRLLVPFRTWRNNITGEASKALMSVFDYPIPQRWSIAHLYQSIMDDADHVKDLAYMTTLSGYVHWKLTGNKVLGVGDASGMFPIDSTTCTYYSRMADTFDNLIAHKNYPWKFADIMPMTLVAGDEAGCLTEEGALLLDPTGQLKAGVSMCPPEGDAGTGMVATNSVAERTGNVSAGTSIFAMVVLEKELSRVHEELDLVTTPSGKSVAMAHSNNCTSNLDGWVGLFEEALSTIGMTTDKTTIYNTLYKKALEGDADCGGLLSYGYLSGEHMTHFEEGRPLFVRAPESNFNLANFMRVNMQTSLGAMKIGMDILLKEEDIRLDKMLGHGGFFKVKEVGQRFMAAAVNAPVDVMETAGEGGAWGIALLASYHINSEGRTLEQYLEEEVFIRQDVITIEPVQADVEGFEIFMERYKQGLAIERSAVEAL